MKPLVPHERTREIAVEAGACTFIGNDDEALDCPGEARDALVRAGVELALQAVLAAKANTRHAMYGWRCKVGDENDIIDAADEMNAIAVAAIEELLK